MISPENLEFKGPTKRNKQYCVVGQSLDWRYGDNVDLIIPIDTNGDLMVPIKGVEQDPDLGVKIINLSIYDDSEVTESEIEENNDDTQDTI